MQPDEDEGHSVVCFDTAVADLTEMLEDPVDVLFGVQLGGGTDINGALAYWEGLIRQPLLEQTLFQRLCPDSSAPRRLHVRGEPDGATFGLRWLHELADRGEDGGVLRENPGPILPMPTSPCL